MCALKERLLATGEVFSVVRCDGCGLIRTEAPPADLGRYYSAEYGPHQPAGTAPSEWLGGGLKGAVRRHTLAAHFGYPLADVRGARGRLIAGLTRPFKGRYVTFPAFRPGGRLLEVGCATGARLALLRALGWDVQGVETSAQACRLAKALYGLRVFCGELEEVSLPAGSLDAVVMSHVLEHVRDPVATLREARRVLRPSGVVVIETPNVASLGRRLFGPYWYEWDVPRHLFLFDAWTLGLACDRAGLRLRRVVYSSYMGDWTRSLALWCRDHGLNRLAGRLAGRPRGLEFLLTPMGYLLAWTGRAGRMIALAGAA